MIPHGWIVILDEDTLSYVGCRLGFILNLHSPNLVIRSGCALPAPPNPGTQLNVGQGGDGGGGEWDGGGTQVVGARFDCWWWKIP
mmetsp:Transcript_11498/g.28325  ORF Transcript_11498/g.28325 Transcript_11498/m.28325 type:complete len:85 (-) Transcript_11498:81-335(-)